MFASVTPVTKSVPNEISVIVPEPATVISPDAKSNEPPVTASTVTESLDKCEPANVITLDAIDTPVNASTSKSLELPKLSVKVIVLFAIEPDSNKSTVPVNSTAGYPWLNVNSILPVF